MRSHRRAGRSFSESLLKFSLGPFRFVWASWPVPYSRTVSGADQVLGQSLYPESGGLPSLMHSLLSFLLSFPAAGVALQSLPSFFTPFFTQSDCRCLCRCFSHSAWEAAACPQAELVSTEKLTKSSPRLPRVNSLPPLPDTGVCLS